MTVFTRLRLLPKDSLDRESYKPELCAIIVSDVAVCAGIRYDRKKDKREGEDRKTMCRRIQYVGETGVDPVSRIAWRDAKYQCLWCVPSEQVIEITVSAPDR